MNKSVWMSSKFGKDIDALRLCLDDLRECGISRILYNAPIEDIETIMRFNEDIEIHIWNITLLNNDESIITSNPDWFIKNKNGQSCITHPAYVNYYKWLCPNHPEVLDFLTSSIQDLCKISKLRGIHLDYIRLPDVILPKGIQPQYNLEQTSEEPQYDYCYCEHCRKKFQERTGHDIWDKEDKYNIADWKQFRYDSVTELVNQLSDYVRFFNKEISAAVFPTPAIAKEFVRQEWAKWRLDEVYPMMYHNHYLEPVSWIGEAIKQGTKATKANLHAGVFLPALSGKELKQILKICNDSEAAGIALFDAGAITEEHKKVLKNC